MFTQQSFETWIIASIISYAEINAINMLCYCLHVMHVKSIILMVKAVFQQLFNLHSQDGSASTTLPV